MPTLRMKQPLAIVGASTRSAAASAARGGFQPVTADLFADADLCRIATTTRIRPYPEGFLDWLRATEPNGWMYTGALENYPELVDQMAWIAPLLGNPGDVLARVRSPWELAGTLQSAGLLFPETRASSEGLPQDGSWLAKTYNGASGSGVRVLGEEETRRQGGRETRRESGETPALESPCLPASLSPRLVYQRSIAGTPCAAIYVATAGVAELLGVTRQLIGEPWLGSHGFQYSGSIGPWSVSEGVRRALLQLGNVLAAEFELVGLFGVDFVLDGERVWTLEVNPRYTASVEIVERCTGVKAIAAHVAACRDDGWTLQRAGILGTRCGEASLFPTGAADGPARSELQFHVKAILFAKRDIVITEPFADYALTEAIQTPWPTLADVSSAGTLIETGRPILSVFAAGSTVDTAEQQLRKRVAEVEHKVYADC